MTRPEDVILGEIDKFMDEVVDRIFQLSQENLVNPHTKEFKSGKSETVITTDTGNLLRSGNVNRSFLEKNIVYSAPYASDVEFGNAGIRVNPEDLIKWVRRKVLKNKDEKKARSVAVSIANALERRGQSPDPFLEPAISTAKMELL